MTNKPKPGNQPDPTDMAGPAAADGTAAADIAGTRSKLEDEEEEAAKLGDFA